MSKAKANKLCILLGLLSTTSIGSTAVLAQSGEVPGEAGAKAASAAASGDGSDIIVTARRRNETLQEVPVAVSALSGAALEARGITNLEGFARAIPQLFLANSSGSFQGGALGLRGISAGDANVFGDQAVAFNIDGVQIARSTPRTLSNFDIQQIQVLKGPQALFFGKNSPGGVVAITTNDPGAKLEGGARVDYEFNAREIRGEAFLSGPITESLGARVAVLASKIRGWTKNVATPNTVFSPTDLHSPESREFAGRATLKFDNGGAFDAKFKFTYGHEKNDGPASNTQIVYCPLGAAQVSGADDCTPNNRVVRAYLGTRLGTGGINTVTGAPFTGRSYFGDGVPYGRRTQYLAGLEMNYTLSDALTLASNTGYYDTTFQALDNFNQADSLFVANPASPASASGLLASYAHAETKEFSQELRLSSDYSGPMNFMLGGYYQKQRQVSDSVLAVNALNPIELFPPNRFRHKGEAYSFFGSLSYKPVETIELSGGVRYSHEKKAIRINRLLPGSVGGVPFAAGAEVPTVRPERSFSNWSPEGTITWRPTSDVTAYAGWKRGFLSGGFIASGGLTAGAIVPDASYGQEIVQGFEGGIKTSLLDRTLQFNIAAYDYKIKGLQVTAVIPLNGIPTQLTNNAAGATSRGVEIEANWRTPLQGFLLRSALAYNRAKYNSFESSPCFVGQTIALGCNGTLIGGRFRTQDLGGQQLIRSPEWAGTIGAAYALELADGGEINFDVDANYTSRIFTEAVNSPGSVQNRYWLLDASTRYRMANGIEVAFIGRNLTNKYYFHRSSAVPFTGGLSGVAASFQADQAAFVGRGRELRLQLAYRF